MGALDAPAALEEPAAQTAPASAPLSPRQMGLFDAQVRQMRAALDAIAAADLTRAASLLGGLAPDGDPVALSMQARVEEIRVQLERVGSSPPSAQVGAHLELGRRLALESGPWFSLGRTLVARAAAALGPAEGVAAGRLFVEAGDLERARSAILSVAGPPRAASLFALGDVESALDDRSSARRRYRDALLLDPFDPAFDGVADEDVRGLPFLAELEAEVDGDPRAWCAPVGIVAGILPRPRDPTSELPMPADASAAQSALLARAREFVDALVRAASPDVERSREALIEARRCMKRASSPLFAWYLARR
jgi:hypothetical protein